MTSATWDDAVRLDQPPSDFAKEPGKRWHTCRWNGTIYVELPENGLGALIGWIFGPHRLLRIPATEPPLEKIVRTTSTGTRTEYLPRTRQGQEEVDNDIDQYLAEAGTPPRPRGYLWFVPVPAGSDAQQFLDYLEGGMHEYGSDIRFPAEYAAALSALLHQSSG